MLNFLGSAIHSRRFVRILLINVFMWAALAAPAATVPQLRPRQIDKQFISPETDSKISFVPVGAASAEKIDFQLLDYFGNKISEGSLNKSGDGSYETVLNLKPGFYEIKISATGQTLGIHAIPPYSGPADPFFGMGTTFSALATAFRDPVILKYPPERFLEECFTVLKRSGIGSVRELNQWWLSEELQGRMVWDYRCADMVHKYAGKFGIKVLDFFHYYPGWACLEKSELVRNHYCMFSTDLIKLGPTWSAMGKRWGNSSCGFQIGNEPDGGMPSDCVMPQVEAVSYFFSKNNIDIPLVAFALTTRDHSVEFLRSYMRNGILDYSDAIAFHDYSPNPEIMFRLVEDYRTAMRSHPKAGMPLWVTECGRPWVEEKGRALAIEDIAHAYNIAMKTVIAKACGIEKLFPFSLPIYGGDKRTFGLVDRLYSPMRMLAAYVTCVSQLSGKQYIGDLNRKLKGVKNAMVFSDGKTYLSVLNLGKDAGTVSVPLQNLPVLAAFAVDGRRLPVSSTLTIKGGMAYLLLDGKSAEKFVNPDTKAKRLLELAGNYKAVPRKVSPVVFQFVRGGIEAKARSRYGYEVRPEKIGIYAFNLSDRAIKIEPELTAPPEIKVKALPFIDPLAKARPDLRLSPKAKLREMTGVVEIPPKDNVLLEWALDMSGNKKGKVQISVRDKAGLASELVIPFIDTENYFAPENVVEKQFHFEDASRWTKNSSAWKEIISNDPREGAVKIHAEFKKGTNHWIFPVCALKPGESLDGAVGMSFELKAKQENAKEYYIHSILYLVYKHGDQPDKVIHYPTPKENWQTVKIKFNPSDSMGVKAIRIGMGPTGQRLDYWLRNFKVYYRKK